MKLTEESVDNFVEKSYERGSNKEHFFTIYPIRYKSFMKTNEIVYKKSNGMLFLDRVNTDKLMSICWKYIFENKS